MGGALQEDTRPPAVYAASVVPRIDGERTSARYPQLRYDWTRTREALRTLAHDGPRERLVEVAYVNPETGGDCLNTIAFTALMLRGGEEQGLRRMSPAQVFHVVEGRGHAEIDGTTIAFEQGDTFCAPGFARVRLANASGDRPVYLIGADESPVHRKLGVFETGEPRCEPR
jgi:gentisate 1,2-dioxygenase